MNGARFTAGRRRVYLLRHGEALYFDAEGKPLNPRNVGLSEAGIAQARAAGEVLREVRIDRALCSGMPRTRQTAELALADHDLPVQDESDFREIHAGRLREIPPSDLEAVVARTFDRAVEPAASFIGGERFDAFQARILAAFERLLEDPDWQTLLLVSHDAVNRVLLAWAAGLGLEGLGRFEQDTACLNIIDIDQLDGGALRCFIRLTNFTPYDPAKRTLELCSMERIFLAYRPAGEP